MKNISEIVIAIMMVLCEGCATCYVAHLRKEYRESGVSEGVYYGRKEYPSSYPATRIALLVEVPTWWWPSETEIGRGYEAWLWPIGAPMSLVDVLCSVVSDTVMLPYDFIKARERIGCEL